MLESSGSSSRRPFALESGTLRAVVFVEANDEKGTERNGQEYVQPLLVLTGVEYAGTPFPDLFNRLEESLARKYGASPAALVFDSGRTKKIFVRPTPSPELADTKAKRGS
jgi:hypothetical protein